jgi:hypothetical protein
MREAMLSGCARQGTAEARGKTEPMREARQGDELGKGI